jgi:hypothetical protein
MKRFHVHVSVRDIDDSVSYYSARAVDPEALSGAAQAKHDACCDDMPPQGVCRAPKPDHSADAPCCGPVRQAVKKAGCAIAGCGDARH